MCPLCTLHIFQWIIIKLCENVCWLNESAKFDKQPDLMKHFGVVALIQPKLPKLTLCTCTLNNSNSSHCSWVQYLAQVCYPTNCLKHTEYSDCFLTICQFHLCTSTLYYTYRHSCQQLLTFVNIFLKNQKHNL